MMRSTHLNPNKIMKVAVTMAIRRIPFTTGPKAPLIAVVRRATIHFTLDSGLVALWNG